MQVSMVCVFVCFIYLLLNENESSRKFRFLYVYLSIYWFGCSSANLFNGIILSLILSPNSHSPQKHILTNSKLLIRKKKKTCLCQLLFSYWFQHIFISSLFACACIPLLFEICGGELFSWVVWSKLLFMVFSVHDIYLEQT